MTTTRKKRPTSSRDKAIHHAVKVLLRKQESVALQYNLTPARISQIVKQVGQELDEYLLGEDLGQLAADARRMRELDWACQQRREVMWGESTELLEQLSGPLEERTTTYEGSPDAGNEPAKTVVKLKAHTGAVQVLKARIRLNEAMQGAGRRPASAGRTAGPASSGTRGSSKRKGQDDAELFPPPVKRPLPECLPASDRAQWDQLPREVQDLAVRRLAIFPDLTLHHATAAEGAHWALYPWRNEAEHNSANMASLVIAGIDSIETYLQQLEHVELSKPFAHPNVLRRDKAGKWYCVSPPEVPLPAQLPPEVAALPAESPERIYWPYKSKAEHFAMLRAEMVLRGDLSREQYESLNRWAQWFTGDKYPDPLARIDKNISASGERGAALAGTKPGPGAAPNDAAPALLGEPAVALNAVNRIGLGT